MDRTMPAAQAPQADRPWRAHYPADVVWDLEIPRTTLCALVDEALRRFADRPCVDFLGKVFTYAEIAALIDRAAAGFRAMGVGPGVGVALCLPNTPFYIVCYHAVLKTGGMVVNCNPLYSAEEMAMLVRDSGAAIMVAPDVQPIAGRVLGLLGQANLKQVVLCQLHTVMPWAKSWLFRLFKRRDIAAIPADPRVTTFARLTDTTAAPPAPPTDPDAVAVLQYTGGTTGVPKAAMLTHANLVANTCQVQAWFPGVQLGAERKLAVLPFFHVFGMTVNMNAALGWGAEIIMLPRYDAKQVIATIRRTRPTLFPGVPTMYRALLDHPELKRDDLRSIRACISGGAPLPVETKREFEAATGCVMVEGYGLTEASPVVFCNPLSGANKAGSIGLPLPRVTPELRALDDPSRCVPQGERGELCVAGPNVMAGYWNRPDETAKVMVGEFLRTGDVGYMDEDGYVFLVDRIKDLIICSGYKVYPRMVEEALYRHDAVAAVIVVGMPDDYRGETPAAFVRLKDGAAATAEELKEFLRDKLSPIEMPSLIEIRDTLPTTMIGKLSKKELRAELLARGGASA